MSSRKIFPFGERTNRHGPNWEGIHRLALGQKKASNVLSPSKEFSPHLAILKFELKNLRWDGRVLEKGVS
jgi:hypothetical protein